MKQLIYYILFLLVPPAGISQVDEKTLGDYIEHAKGDIYYTPSVLDTNMYLVIPPANQRYEIEQPNKKEVFWSEMRGDTLVVYLSWWKYKPQFRDGSSRVFKLDDEVRNYYRERLFFYIGEDDIKFIRKEWGREEDIVIRKVVKEWVYRRE